MSDITNALGRPNNIATVEQRRRRKKQCRASTDENMNPLSLTREKRVCDEGCSGLPSKKRAVCLYDQATLSSIVEAVKQPH